MRPIMWLLIWLFLGETSSLWADGCNEVVYTEVQCSSASCQQTVRVGGCENWSYRECYTTHIVNCCGTEVADHASLPWCFIVSLPLEKKLRELAVATGVVVYVPNCSGGFSRVPNI
jgi:hypothetical protein